MRVVVLADIHANYQALVATLADAGPEIDEYWFLGDLVGYNPEPVDCVNWFQANQAHCRWVVGNHDASLTYLLIASTMGENASNVIRHHRRLLNGQIEWLEQIFDRSFLSQNYDEAGRRFVLAHGSPRPGAEATEYLWFYQPDRYMMACKDISQRQGLWPSTWILHGHHHFPVLYALQDEQGRFEDIPYCQAITLGEGVWFISPGSVGQPRDGDNRAAYAMLDTQAGTIEFRRVEYPYRKVQQTMELENELHNQAIYNDELKKVLYTGIYRNEELLTEYRKVYDDQHWQWGKRARR